MKRAKPNREEMLRVRLSRDEIYKLYRFADKHGVSASHVIREYIRRLPNPKDDHSSLDSYEKIDESLQSTESREGLPLTEQTLSDDPIAVSSSF